ncbi:hypothetical protein AB0N19_40405, partial [Streptomyces sp. NPDC051132]|uniref:hypothetical protein n=1 Tax=Streptomyces sp. NPDC051132 TaxID=3155667 RepID=UPI003442E0C9
MGTRVRAVIRGRRRHGPVAAGSPGSAPPWAIWKISRREVVDHTNVVAGTEEPAGVVTTAI